jgi:hypothetical protein
MSGTSSRGSSGWSIRAATSLPSGLSVSGPPFRPGCCACSAGVSRATTGRSVAPSPGKRWKGCLCRPGPSADAVDGGGVASEISGAEDSSAAAGWEDCRIPVAPVPVSSPAREASLPIWSTAWAGAASTVSAGVAATAPDSAPSSTLPTPDADDRLSGAFRASETLSPVVAVASTAEPAPGLEGDSPGSIRCTGAASGDTRVRCTGKS